MKKWEEDCSTCKYTKTEGILSKCIDCHYASEWELHIELKMHDEIEKLKSDREKLLKFVKSIPVRKILFGKSVIGKEVEELLGEVLEDGI